MRQKKEREKITVRVGRPHGQGIVVVRAHLLEHRKGIKWPVGWVDSAGLVGGGYADPATCGTEWVRGWEGPEVDALRAKAAADNEAMVAKVKADAEAARKRHEEEAAERTRKEHEEIMTAMKTAAELVEKAAVPKDLRRVAYRFAFAVLRRPDTAMAHFFSTYGR